MKLYPCISRILQESYSQRIAKLIGHISCIFRTEDLPAKKCISEPWVLAKLSRSRSKVFIQSHAPVSFLLYCLCFCSCSRGTIPFFCVWMWLVQWMTAVLKKKKKKSIVSVLLVMDSTRLSLFILKKKSNRKDPIGILCQDVTSHSVSLICLILVWLTKFWN